MIDRRRFSIALTLPIVASSVSGIASAEGWFRHRSFRQRARSMLPTIQSGDVVRVALGRAKIGGVGEPGVVQLQRGDLVAFAAPVWSNAIVIFRLMGLPGETITVIDEEGAFIDGVAIEREDAGPAPSDPAYYFDNPAPGPWPELRDACFVRESLPNGISFLTLHQRPRGSYPSHPRRSPVDVPPDNIFLLGDCRDNANDSRFELGMVPLAQVIGKVVSGRA